MTFTLKAGYTAQAEEVRLYHTYFKNFIFGEMDKLRHDINYSPDYKDLHIDILNDSNYIGTSTATRASEEPDGWDCYENAQSTTITTPDRSRWGVITDIFVAPTWSQTSGYIEFAGGSGTIYTKYFFSVEPLILEDEGEFYFKADVYVGGSVTVIIGMTRVYPYVTSTSNTWPWTHATDVTAVSYPDTTNITSDLFKMVKTNSQIELFKSTDEGLNWTSQGTGSLDATGGQSHILFQTSSNGPSTSYVRLYWILNTNQSPKYSYTNGDFVSATLDDTSNTITHAQLEVDDDDVGGITYYLSADGGSNWESVTVGEWHTFTNTGSDLRMKATLGASDKLYGYAVKWIAD